MLAVASDEAQRAALILREHARSAMSEEELVAADHAINLDAEQNDCPACGGTIANGQTRCPGCGLRIG